MDVYSNKLKNQTFWRKICLCVYRQKYFFKETSLNMMPVGEIASFVRKMFLYSKVFINVVVFILTGISILR